MNASTAVARWVISRLRERGVTEVVVCPGSRNAPLLFAVADEASLRVHSRIDERTAGFLALGLAKTSRRPVAVITTSGTATANLHPAVLEAAHAGVALVAVTADRPAALRGTGANQTTDQVRLFGTAAGFADLAGIDQDALDAAWHEDGPVHLNVQFSEPLMPDVEGVGADSERSALAAAWELRTSGSKPTPLPPGPRTVVVAGDDAGPPARLLAQGAGWPLFAEPTSGARTGTHALRHYRLLLDGGLAGQIERVVVYGHPTLSRPVTRLLAREDVEVVSVPPRGRWTGRPFEVALEAAALSAQPDDPAWLEAWRAADAAAGRAVGEVLADQAELTPYDVAAEVAAAVPAGGLLVVGASSPIRDLDLMATPYPAGERRLVIANRGLAGIDGTVSTAIGAALGRPHSSRAIAYLGDVTFLHDLTGLIAGRGNATPDLSIVVANDDGGSIFAMLEQGAAEYADRYERLFGTPHGIDLAATCAAARVPHWQVGERAELAHALANPNGGIEVIEARIRRDNRRELDRALRAAAALAADSLRLPASATPEEP